MKLLGPHFPHAVTGGPYDGLAVTQAPNGNPVDAWYKSSVCLFFHPNEPTNTDSVVKSVSPRRGVLAGGTKLSVYGINFAGLGATVSVGGQPCTNVFVVSSTKMECRLPTGTIGGKYAVVTIGGRSDIFANGY